MTRIALVVLLGWCPPGAAQQPQAAGAADAVTLRLRGSVLSTRGLDDELDARATTMESPTVEGERHRERLLALHEGRSLVQLPEPGARAARRRGPRGDGSDRAGDEKPEDPAFDASLAGYGLIALLACGAAVVSWRRARRGG